MTVIPHIWFAYKPYGFGSVEFKVYGKFGEEWEGSLYVQPPPVGWNGLGNRPTGLPSAPEREELDIEDWEFQAATGNAYNSNRRIYAGSDQMIGEFLDTEDVAVTNLEVDILTVTVPDDLVPTAAAGPKGLIMYFETYDDEIKSNQILWVLNPFIPVPLASVSGALQGGTQVHIQAYPPAGAIEQLYTVITPEPYIIGGGRAERMPQHSAFSTTYASVGTHTFSAGLEAPSEVTL